MKTNLLIFFVATAILASCSKNDSNDATTPDSYINTNAGSTWNYHQIDSGGNAAVASDYTITSTSEDTTINSKKYHVYNNSTGGNKYMTEIANVYYELDSIPVPGGKSIERSYLEDNQNVGTSWTQTFDLTIPSVQIPVTGTVTNTIKEKGITRNVNGTNYSNVIHVSTSLSSPLIISGFTSAIDSYYAPKYGLIESKTVVHLNYLGLSDDVNMTIQLNSADLK